MSTTQVFLRPYYLSKWICPFHGHFTARTAGPVDENFPINCPECRPTFVEQAKGMTIQPVPFISKPRIPKKTDIQPSASSKAPLRKRGVSW